MLNSAWYCGTKAFRGSVRILTREPSSKECKLTTTGRRPTNSGIIPNSTRSRASTWLSSLSRSALSSRTSGWEFLKMSSSFSFEPRSLIGAPKPITWIEERLVSKGRYDKENIVERHSSSLMNYIGKRNKIRPEWARKGVFMGTCIRSLQPSLRSPCQKQKNSEKSLLCSKHQNTHVIYYTSTNHK